ncbi:MAG TPA: LD-carboxypeptidase [Thermoanaerobaculia bacterium]|nr:LD-carboxypeptidase [Thermoanaerobaculia bacterium]
MGVAAISGRVDPARLDAGIARLRSRGYRVVEAPNVRSTDAMRAGTDAQRAAGYRRLVSDPEVDAIFFARGGWGAARILDRLDPDEVARHPKIQMGGSDLTTLFAWLQARAGLVAFHGPMVAVDFARAEPDPETDASWEPVLRGDAPLAIPIATEQVLAGGSGSGLLVGGCLSMLVALEGTPEALDTRGRVVFWEDVGEEIYRLDRMLTHWRRAGRLAEPAGVIIGKLENIRNNGIPDEEGVSSLLAEHFAGAPYPVVRDFPAGHGARNRTLPLGTRVTLDASAGAVRFEEAAVS